MSFVTDYSHYTAVARGSCTVAGKVAMWTSSTHVLRMHPQWGSSDAQL